MLLGIFNFLSNLTHRHTDVSRALCCFFFSGINQNFISTQSKSQTREPLLRTADMRAEANQSHSGMRGMVSPPLLPPMDSLTISHTASEWEKGQCAQATVGKNIFMHAPCEVKEKQGEGNNSDSTVGKRFHPPILCSVVNAQVNWAMDTACINKAVNVVGTSESDYEVKLFTNILLTFKVFATKIFNFLGGFCLKPTATITTRR